MDGARVVNGRMNKNGDDDNNDDNDDAVVVGGEDIKKMFRNEKRKPRVERIYIFQGQLYAWFTNIIVGDAQGPGPAPALHA